MQSLLAAVAGLGLLIVCIGHVGLVSGHDFYGKCWNALFIGIFVVWFPAMAFFAAAWGLALAAAGRESLGIEWKCERGHEMHPGAKFCEECGAPAVHREVL